MIWWSLNIFHPSVLLCFSAHKDWLPTEREAIAARIGSTFKNMSIRIDENSLSMTHSIFPWTFYDGLMTKKVELQRYTAQEAPFQHNRFSRLVLCMFVNAALAMQFLPLPGHSSSNTSTAPAGCRDGLLDIQAKIQHGRK